VEKIEGIDLATVAAATTSKIAADLATAETARLLRESARVERLIRGLYDRAKHIKENIFYHQDQIAEYTKAGAELDARLAKIAAGDWTGTDCPTQADHGVGPYIGHAIIVSDDMQRPRG
jgi:hypothetical protein